MIRLVNGTCPGPGGALIVAAVFAALGALILLGRAGAAISAGPAPAVMTVPADRTTARPHSGREGPVGAARRDRASREQCVTTTLT